MYLDGCKCLFGGVGSRLKFTEKQCRRANGFQFGPVDVVRKLELPSSDLVVDRRFRRIIKLQAAGGEYPTVVGATGPRPVYIDRASPVDQHWAVPVLVVPHQYVANWEPRRREEHIPWDHAKCVYLVGGDVNELRGGTARRATAAGNVGRVSSTYDPLNRVQPCGEPPGIEWHSFVHLDSARRLVTCPGYWGAATPPHSCDSGRHNFLPARTFQVHRSLIGDEVDRESRQAEAFA